jgi:hypothetical protein
VIKRPSFATVALALVPLCALCLSVPLWDRVTPRVLGLPFNIFWIMAWISVTPALLNIMYRIERKR